MTRILGAGGGGGSGCFLGDTLVAIPGGSRRIDELQPGDLVLSFDDAGALHEAKVLKVHTHKGERVIRYQLWGGQYVDATPNHWVLNQFNAFVEINTLGPDDCLVDANNHLRPIVKKTELCIGTVYNLTVEGHHTFIANNIRVHNAGLGLGIAGAGGGGGGGGKGGGGGGASRTPTEADDSLQSVQYGSVLDLLSEGEIQGIEGGNKGIYLEGTPIEDASGSQNFSGYTVETRNGTQAQSYISQQIGTESEKAVNVEVVNATPVVRTISDSDVDRVRVTIQVPSLQIIEDDGDIVGHSVQVRIQVQYNSGGYTTVVDDTISGKTSNRYQRDYMIPLSGAFPVDVKVIRVSADEASAKRQNETYWFSYTEIIDEKLRYPNSALAYLRFDSRQFDSIPSRKYLVRGIKVRLPSNATVDTTTYIGRVTYAGIWNGTFGAAQWCSDPAWCLYDLLTSTRYGASVPASSLDKYDFYAISQYCNQLVSNGRNGLEPRFSCNLLINSRDEVYNVIQEMTSLFRGIAYYGAGSLVLLQDKPTDSQYLLGPSNVVDGLFVYSGTSQKARHTTATVAWQSYDTLGEVEYEYVEDAAAVAKYGIINKDIKALGCYSQSQAHRAGKWALLSEQNLTETVTFSVSIDSGIILRPGMVIDVADPMKAGARRSGRINTATTTTITVDDNTDFDFDYLTEIATISVLMPTGLVETRTISNIVSRTVTVTPAFSEAPNSNSIWMIETATLQPQQFRVLNVAESEDGIYGVTALQYNSSIYAAIESDVTLTTRDITRLSDKPDAPSSLQGTEFLYQDGQSVFSGFDLSWISPKQRVTEFRVKYRIDNDNWTQTSTTSPSLKITNTRSGTLYVQVTAVNYVNVVSEIASAQFPLVGKTALPGNVQNLSFEAISNNSGRLRWSATIDLDVKVGGRVHIRHNNKTDGSASWSDSVDLVEAKAGSATEAIIPLVEGEVLVKFEDDGGRQSGTEASVIIDLPDALDPLLVQTRREDQDATPFSGTKSNTTYDAGLDALKLTTLSGNSTTGTYTFANYLDLGGIYSLDLRRYFVTRGYRLSDLFDSRTNNVDDWPDWDGVSINYVNAKLMVRSTDNNPAGASPTWSSWQEFVNGTFKARGFQFRADLSSYSDDENILVDQLGYDATFQRRTEQSATAIASGAGAKNITFANAFWTGTAALGGVNAYLPSIGITGQNLGTGDYFEVTSVSSTGFTVTFRNSAGTAVDRNFNWIAVGFGKAG